MSPPMTAPSIKEALEYEKRIREKIWDSACLTAAEWVYLVGIFQAANEHEECPALATLQPSGERREAITSPSDDLIGFAIQETFGGRCSTSDADCYTCKAWEQYDRLLASGLVQDEAGIRADYVSVPLEPTQAMVAAGEEVCCASARDNCATIYRAMIAAIRSARDGGAS